MRKEYGLLTVAILLLASGHPVGKIILSEINSVQLATVATVLASTVIWIALLATGGRRELRSFTRKDLYLTMSAGLLSFTLYPIMTFSALARIPPAINALLVGTSPILIAVISGTI